MESVDIQSKLLSGIKAATGDRLPATGKIKAGAD
jgi:hypothetical protein